MVRQGYTSLAPVSVFLCWLGGRPYVTCGMRQPVLSPCVVCAGRWRSETVRGPGPSTPRRRRQVLCVGTWNLERGEPHARQGGKSGSIAGWKTTGAVTSAVPSAGRRRARSGRACTLSAERCGDRRLPGRHLARVAVLARDRARGRHRAQGRVVARVAERPLPAGDAGRRQPRPLLGGAPAVGFGHRRAPRGRSWPCRPTATSSSTRATGRSGARGPPAAAMPATT